MKRFSQGMMFLAALVVGLGISLTMSQIPRGKNTEPTDQSYAVLLENRNTLRKDIYQLTHEIDYLTEKKEAYELVMEDEDGLYEKMHKELLRNGRFLGYEEVRGPGLQLKLQDGPAKEGEVPGSMDSWLRIIHNEDMLKLLNELRIHGAEAIEINGQRVTETSEIFCSWAFISINGEKLPAPFTIKVVGDLSRLSAYGVADFTQIKNLLSRGILVEVEKRPIMTLEASIAPLTPLFAEENQR
ncbi:MAG TPA: hypothetical protein DEA52_02590 [Clostridiaceae bacterium]|nr:hypothetical protein [Clostridiaceae bacterium]